MVIFAISAFLSFLNVANQRPMPKGVEVNGSQLLVLQRFFTPFKMTEPRIIW